MRKMIEWYDRSRLFDRDQILLIDMTGDGIKYTCWEIEKSKKIKEQFSFKKDWDTA